ncbi:hypothetical protein [Caldimonas sp. KR1-144]|uniref:hypothetical protein n=1 Tax=Caldimonas sp. KR1-144 TaxID=3400911 RepID=UPI003C0F5FB1
MPATVLPVKTALGREELRRRSHGLSQRHRTVLLLVDGARPLSVVLSLAQKAGASVQHFEELVRLGLVELPQVPTLTAEPESESLFESTGGDTTSGSNAEADLDVVPEAAVEPAVAASEPVEAVEVQAPPEPTIEAAPAALPEPAAAPAAMVSGAVEPLPVRRALPADIELPVLEPGAEPMPHVEIDLAPPPLEARRPEARAPRLVGEELIVHEVRELLLAAIEAMPPRHRLHKRLHKAATINDLVDVIEMIERLVRRQGGASANGKLMSDMLFARDMLGLGNTRFVETEAYDGARQR